MRRRNSGTRLYQRGRIWWTQYYDPEGRRHDVSTKCRDRDAALEVATRIERDGANPKASAQNAATVGDACQLYLKNKRRLITRDKRSAESLEFFETKIGNVERILQKDGPVRLVDLLPKHLDAYVEAREQEPGAAAGSTVSAHTIKKELVAFRQALELMKREGLFDGEVNPLFPADHTAEYEPRDRALDRDELSRLIQALLPVPGEQHRPLADGDRAARVAFLVATAARWSGSERCMRADVAPDLSWVRLRETKTKAAERVVPIVTAEQKVLLDFAVRNAGGTDRLFRPWDSKSRDFVRACERARIERCSPNDLRRTMATWMRAAGASPDVIGMVMGHTTARMVETVYARLARRPQEVRRLLEAQLKLGEDCSVFAAERARSAAFGAPGALALTSQVLNIQVNARKDATA